MTTQELKDKLNSMSEPEFQQFRRDFGGDGQTREWYVEAFIQDPKHERRLCHLFGFPMEDDRRTDAAIQSARADADTAQAAKEANMHATEANEISRRSNRIAIAAFVLAFLAILLTLGQFLLSTR